jgi:hypothetical protein
MHSLLSGCGRPVRKAWRVCVGFALLSPHYCFGRPAMWLSGVPYSRFIPRFTTPFSTYISGCFYLFLDCLCSLSTRPTNITTSFLNLIKPLFAAKELTI